MSDHSGNTHLHYCKITHTTEPNVSIAPLLSTGPLSSDMSQLHYLNKIVESFCFQWRREGCLTVAVPQTRDVGVDNGISSRTKDSRISSFKASVFRNMRWMNSRCMQQFLAIEFLLQQLKRSGRTIDCCFPYGVQQMIGASFSLVCSGRKISQ
jgi:hypothetical protein